MKKYIFELIVFVLISIYFICCIIINGIYNISLYNITLYLFASPLIEEYIFRGLVQDKINKFVNKTHFFHISAGNLISSILFTSAHCIINPFFIQNLFVIIPSLYLGYLYDKYKTLKMPVLFHSFFNINIFTAYPFNSILNFFIDKI